ncbi:hypothetical protein [Belnapia moabensis]|uniref:hypothetical protein n=1 Tax=Belnapia moabensis TaxID=365533 RepID=UPI0012EE5901|nr:hypothetical protein [Belnapia moabensis]
MLRLYGAVLVICLGFACVKSASAERVTPTDRAGLQAAMAQHIDRQLVDGAYLQLKVIEGAVNPLVPAKTHSRIVQMGQFFVLCTDFRDQQGNPVNVDFYMAREGQNFLVFHTEIANRGPLQGLMRAGQAKIVE